MAAPLNEKPLYWFEFNVERYSADTGDLTTPAHGALLLLRIHYFRTGALTHNNAILARIAKATPTQWKRLRAEIERFFIVDGTYWVNPEWEQDFQKCLDKAFKKSAAGKTGALARWGNRNRGSGRNADAMRSHSDRNANYTDTTPCPSQGGVSGGESVTPVASRAPATAADISTPGASKPPQAGEDDYLPDDLEPIY